MDSGPLGRALIIIGLSITALGLVLAIVNKVPFIGRLPGDIYIQKKNFAFYFPLATSLIASIILSLIFYLWHRR